MPPLTFSSLLGLVHVVARGEDGRLASHLQLQLRDILRAGGPADRMLQHVAVREHAFRGEEDVVAASLRGEDRILRAVGGRGLGRQDLCTSSRHAVEIGGADLRRIVFRVAADLLAFAVADYIGACATGARHDDLIDISAADTLDAQQRFHARIGIAGKRDS